MKENQPDLRQPYNNVSLAAARMLGLRNSATIDRALYGIYCEALVAIQKAIEQGASLGDLEKTIQKFGAKGSRILTD